MTVETLANEVHAFLKTYMLAFESLDGAKIATLYHGPCVTVRADGSVHCLQKQEEARAFFETVADTYFREGCRRWRYLDLEVVAIGARSALASLDWEMLREDGSTMRRWRQSYNLLSINAGWKILASTFHQR